MLQYVSGFCGGHQQCEGTKPRSPSGKPMKVCVAWLRCPCECHERITSLFAMAGKERRILDNPEYVPPVHKFVMPSWDEVMQARAERLAQSKPAAQVVESDSELVPTRTVQQFTPTETGRAARGQLEQYVEEACGAWLKTERDEACTTAWVSEWIGKTHHMEPPSRGAIDAVWNRWTLYGFAFKGSKPTQFFGYTKPGREKGLAVMREEYKARNKRAEREVALGRKR